MKDERDEDGDRLTHLEPAGEGSEDIAETRFRVHIALFLFLPLRSEGVLKDSNIATTRDSNDLIR